MLSVAFLYLPFAKILRILSLPLPILGEAHCHGHRIAFKQTKEKNRQSYLYPGGRPRAAYPFPTRLLPIEYFPLPLRNISLPPRKIVHFCHRAGVSSHFIFPWPGLHLLPWVQMNEFFYLERYITYIIFTVQCGTEQRIKGWKSRPLESIWGHQAMSRILCIVYLIFVDILYLWNLWNLF